MTTADLVLLLGMSIVMSYTPGPNNTLVTYSAARFGFVATIPHIVGIGLGFPVMIFCVALGLGALFEQSQILRETLRILGVLVLIWLCWKIATAGPAKSPQQTDRPFRFQEAAAFQWINPKGWLVAISIVSQFVSQEAPLLSAIVIAIVFVFAGLSSASLWAALGLGIERLLTNPLRVRMFNVTMAAMLLVTIITLLFADLAA